MVSASNLNSWPGQLLFSKYFNADQKLSKDDQYDNLIFDKQDPLKIAAQFFALIKMTDIMFEEYKDEYPEALERDQNARQAFKTGFTSYSSDNIDYLLEHHAEFDVTLVLFYSKNEMCEAIMRTLAYKLLDVLVLKNEKRLKTSQQALS